MKNENITLYCKLNGSDKEYTIKLTEKNGLYTVDYAYGKRGKPQTQGTKTANPVGYPEAKKIYDQMYRQRLAKGYTPGEDGVAYSATPDAEVTDMLPQLLNAVPEESFRSIFDDWSYICFQQKHDGERRMVTVEPGGPVIAANRRGLRVVLPEAVEKSLTALSERLGAKLVLDGEDMGEHLVIFDVLELGRDIRKDGFHRRAMQIDYLQDEMMYVPGRHPIVWEPAVTVMNPSALNQWVDNARQSRWEGVVLKDPDAPYTVGRPNSGGPALKYKFVESCTCVVLERNKGKRSVQLGVKDNNGAILFIGNVTIPANYDIPNPGQYVEIEYLYAYPDGGSLYQPQYKGVRADKTTADDYDSLKFKG
jgi:bifunctional non-homologous end joining protein LigD